MADINQIITLGIGTPGDIEHFILLGLNVRALGAIDTTLQDRDFTGTLWEREFGDADLYERNIALTLGDRPDG